MNVTRPALRYFGGKWRIAGWVISHLPEHRTFVEAFGGGASVLLQKPKSRIEVFNDIAGAVVNFFRVLRDRPGELLRALELTPFALDEYKLCRAQDGDELERARRFFVRSWGGYQGTSGSQLLKQLRSRGWRRPTHRDQAGEYAGAIQSLPAAVARLQQVSIDHLDWREVLDRYDKPDTCFYLDPPYLHSTRGRTAPSDGYGEHELSGEDHRELCERARSLAGAVVLSGYPSPEYDAWLEGWDRHQRGHHHRGGRTVEVLWCSPTRQRRLWTGIA